MIFPMTLFFGFIWLYIACHGIHFMASPKWVKIGLLVLLLPGIVDIVVVLAWGSKMPQWLIHLFAAAGLALIYLGVGTLVLDLIRWTFRPIPYLADVIVIVGLILSAYAVYRAHKLPVVHEITVHSAELPSSWQPLKIVQLTDLHIGQGFTKERLASVVQQVNILKPDVIFITGDSIDQPVTKLGEDMRALEKLEAPTYMVLGNHEYYYGPDAWRKHFEQMGIPVLVNHSITLNNHGQQYVVGGADFGGWIQKEKIPENLDTTFTGTDENLPRLLLVHYPIVFDEAIKRNVLLQLSGHTHGGMTPPISWITRLFNGGYVSGLYKKGKSTLYVSDGTGLWTGIPARLGSSNEIVVIYWER